MVRRVKYGMKIRKLEDNEIVAMSADNWNYEASRDGHCLGTAL
jgi:hypothetical protein